MRRRFCISLLFIAFAPLAFAQTAPANGFDFLVGDWSLDVRVKVSGLAAWIHGTPKLVGTWNARRTDTGIDDELKIFDASGNPRTSLRSQRTWDAAAARWSITSADAYHARNGSATGRQEGDDMRVDGSHTDGDGKTTLTRTRYYAITRDAFRLRQDRSYDDGATWDEGALEIDAKRVATPP